MSLLLVANKISKSFGDQKIFEKLSLNIYSGDRIGITGPNGAGKTTLLKVLSGQISPDEGSVKIYTPVSYIRQQDDGVPEVDSSPTHFIENTRLAGILKLNQQGLHEKMSGGEKAKARFVFSFDPSCGLLIADEPTSNMDMDSEGIIEKELLNYQGALLIVSHDRSILDRLCSTMIEVSNGEIKIYTGNYSDYVRQRDAAHQRQSFEYESYIKERSRLKNRIAERTENMHSVKKAPSRMGNSEARLHKREVTAIQKKLNQGIDNLETRLNMLDKKQRPQDLPQVMMRIDPPENPVSSRIVRCVDLNIVIQERLLIKNAAFEILTGKRTALMGKNGTGKTTLADLINHGDDRLTIAPGVQIGYFKQDFSILEEKQTILDNVMAGSIKPQHEARGILARLLISGDDVNKRVSCISGGEKVKVSIAKILVSKANFIILDEPTNYLDVFSMEALEKVLCDYTGTLLLISHDRKFIENIAERLLILENDAIKTFEGCLAEYEESLKEVSKPLNKANSLDAAILQMKLAELSSKIYSCPDEKKKLELEAQYQALLSKS